MLTILATSLIFGALFGAAYVQYALIRRLAGRAGIVVDTKQALPFVVPLLNTVVYLVLAVCVWAIFHRTTHLVAALVAIASVFAAVTAPLTFLVPLALDAGNSATIESAVRRWDALTRSRRLMLVGLQLIPIAASTLTLRLIATDAGPEVLFAPLVYLATWTLSQWQIVESYTRNVDEGADASATRWRVLLPIVLGAAISGPCVLVLTAQASRPAPMALREHAPDAHVYTGRRSYSLPGRVSVMPTVVGLAVQVAAGPVARIRYGPSCPADEAPEIATIEARNEIQIFAHACERWHVLTVNSAGERLDDSLMERLVRQVGAWGLGSLLCALLLLGFALARVVPTLRKAKRIAGVVHRDDLTKKDQESIVEGTLRLGELPKLVVRKGQLRGSGHIELELDGDRFMLPLPASVQCAEGEYSDGARVSLIGVFSSTTRGHRDASIPWPKRAFLVASEAASARETWLWRATRLARLSAMASVVAVVVTYAAYIAHFQHLARFLR
ncbi:MAG: hypothetical protein AB8H86_11525 [Polyangiales bacterium]